MTARRSLALMFLCLLVILAVAVGCAKKPSDGQIIGEVATKIQADPNLQTKAVAVQSQDGVVTLTGQVATEMERTAAANDAGQVAGVRTVVNNLTVASAAAAPAPVAPPVEQPKAAPVQVAKSTARHNNAHSSRRRNNDYAPPSDTLTQQPAASLTPAPMA